MSAKQRICVIIPAYNEAETLPAVIESVRRELPEADMVVMNDGSVDATSDIAHGLGVTVLDLPINLGIGGAVQTGIKYAWRNDYDVAVELDGDGQHNPSYARTLVDGLEEDGGSDLVIGSRFVASSDYRSSPMRQFGIHLFSWLIKLMTGKRVYDSTSGFRTYNRRAMKYLSHDYPADFPEPESIVMLLSRGFRIKELPVEMRERQGGVSVVASDVSWKAIYFVASNAIAIVLTGVTTRYVTSR